MDYTVYTDGGCLSNPDGPGGIGIVIIDNETGEIVERSQGYKCTTNNRMEILAAIIAMELIPAGKEIHLFSDSQYMVNCANGYFQKKKNLDLWARFESAKQGKTVHFQWVRGHHGNANNERCDQLATRAMEDTEHYTDDVGFTPLRTGVPSKVINPRAGGAQKQIVGIPDQYNEAPDVKDVSQYMNAHKVAFQCALDIKRFYETPGRSFGAFANLKTHGLDDWSPLKKEELIQACGQEQWDIAMKNLHGDERMCAAAIRWRGRGLRLEDAIRKVLVDHEVSLNAKSRGGFF